MQKRLFSRKWLLTIPVPEQWGRNHDVIKRSLKRLKGICYWCMCDEIGKISYTYHTHLYIVGENAIPFSEIKKRFPAAHIEVCKGSDEEIIAYIKKEGRYKTDKEINLKETFEQCLKNTSIISEMIWRVKRLFRRQRC